MEVGTAWSSPRSYRPEMDPVMGDPCTVSSQPPHKPLSHQLTHVCTVSKTPGWGISGLGDFGCKPWHWLLEIARGLSYLLEPS